MPKLRDSSVSLTFSGDALQPEILSPALGLEATRFGRKGGPDCGETSYKKPLKTGHWRLSLEFCDAGDLDAQIAEIFAKATNDLVVWRDMSSQFGGAIYFGWFITEWNSIARLSAQTITACAARGLRMDFDLYRSEESAEEDHA
jgi:hypothetical protein